MDATRAAIEGFVTKYLAILGMEGGPRPIVKIRNNLVSKWLGLDRWTPGEPTTTLFLQRSILHDPRSLERVVAHEMVHHRDFLRMTPEELSRLRAMLNVGFKPRDGHGKTFLEGAARINAVMGEDFVNVTSDQTYIKAPSTKPYFLLIRPYDRNNPAGRLGYSWAVKIMPKAKPLVMRYLGEGAKLIQVTDEIWTGGKAKINDRYGGMNIPRPGTPHEAMLRELYEKAPAVSPEGHRASMLGVMMK